MIFEKMEENRWSVNLGRDKYFATIYTDKETPTFQATEKLTASQLREIVTFMESLTIPD